MNSREVVFIGLGSNIGDRRGYLEQAITSIGQHANIQIEKQSSFIETEPVGEHLNAPFLNGVIKCCTSLDPFVLLNELQRIEQDLGRTQKGTNQPRTIDLDILFYGQEILETSELDVPHPKAHQREFVLGPMVEIEPGFNHPVLNKSMKELFSSLSN